MAADFRPVRNGSLPWCNRVRKKYVICNADEGDPGAFMDRSVMEGNPHSVIEGMLIAAHAIGADEGFFYVRAEYPLAVKRIKKAVADAQRYGLLGDNVFNTGRSLKLNVMEGAGAFVCGEETALIASIEGKRGMPLPKPPFPAQSGLWGEPTVINNVETLATVPLIMRSGVDAFRRIGVPSSPGTKTFALTGTRRQHGPDRSTVWNARWVKLSSISAGESSTTREIRFPMVSKPSRSAGRPAGALRRNTSTCRWTSIP